MQINYVWIITDYCSMDINLFGNDWYISFSIPDGLNVCPLNTLS